MSQGWDGLEAAPLEFFHSELLKAFHELRLAKGDSPEKTCSMNGIEFNNIVAKIKVATYKKYPKQVSSKAIPKSNM